MKKIVLGIVFVFATVTFVNANSNVVVKAERNSCVEKALNATKAIAECFGEDIRGEHQDEYLAMYINLYEGCMS